MASFFYAGKFGAALAEFCPETAMFDSPTTKNTAQSIDWTAFKTVSGWA
jgi:hypothetical protein